MSFSACNLTSGVTLGCRSNLGSLKKIWILGGDVTSTAADTNEEITNITGTGTFYLFELEKNTSSLTETLNQSLENGTVFYQTDLSLVLHKLEQEKRNQIKLLARHTRLKVVAEDMNGTQFYLGSVNGGYLSASTSATGTAMGDLNGYTLVITFLEPEMNPSLSAELSTIVTGITVE